MIRRPPRPPLFPYPTLSRSRCSTSQSSSTSTRLPTSSPSARGCSSSSRARFCRVRRNSRALPPKRTTTPTTWRSEEHTSELQSQSNLVCRLLLEKKKHNNIIIEISHRSASCELRERLPSHVLHHTVGGIRTTSEPCLPTLLRPSHTSRLGHSSSD